jgi:hypothetical protein
MSNIIISLDFEMRWGVHHIYGADHEAYRTEIENVQHIVPLTLKMLEERNLRATWATVGAILLESWEEYLSIAPNAPNYKRKSLIFDQSFIDKNPIGEQYFAPKLVDLITNTEGQELGGHSFSHLYFDEEGVTENDFTNDTIALIKTFKQKLSLSPVSYVYPRNQVIYTQILSDNGFKTWRTNNNEWFHNANSNNISPKNLLAKILRVSDAVNPIIPFSSKSVKFQIFTIFIRFPLPEPLWAAHLFKIRNLVSSLNRNNILHLWWHPHNLGNNLAQKSRRMEDVLDIVAEGCSGNTIRSSNMSEVCYEN